MVRSRLKAVRSRLCHLALHRPSPVGFQNWRGRV